jgi:hypothetical protein
MLCRSLAEIGKDFVPAGERLAAFPRLKDVGVGGKVRI